MKVIHNIKMPLSASENDIFEKIKKDYNLPSDTHCFIYKESIDCRHKNVSKVYSVALDTDIDNKDFTEIIPYSFNPNTDIDINIKPVIVGMGPAGLFCALTLSEFNIKPIIIDRGKPIEERISDVKSFWTGNLLNEESNVQFGEGGAGTFSDGKLTCRKNDPRSRKILETFVKYGAPEEILKTALPHIGTDILQKVIINIRNDLIKKGTDFIYNSKLTDIIMENGNVTEIKTSAGNLHCDNLILAIGNGSFDTFSMLMSKNLVLETKPLSFGIRQEHLQTDINRAIYGKEFENPLLPPASYSFYKHLDKNTCVYTFCMCPGGVVVNASSIKGRLVTNGMSFNKRNLKNANSALLLTVNPVSISEAMEIQKNIEEKAFKAGSGKFPISYDLKSNFSIKTNVKPTVLPESVNEDFSKIFPSRIFNSLKTGTELFHKQIFGNVKFEKPVYTAPETRTSSPIRLKRDPVSLKALKTKNLYPCGEGVGYAGGIMSSAIDGMKIGEAIITNNKKRDSI